jgi:hypothetical protein
MSLLSVEGYTNLKKDPSSGGVVNIDKTGYEAYKRQRAFARRNIDQQRVTHDSVVHLQDQINNIKDDLDGIKNMLLQLIQKGN